MPLNPSSYTFFSPSIADTLYYLCIQILRMTTIFIIGNYLLYLMLFKINNTIVISLCGSMQVIHLHTIMFNCHLYGCVHILFIDLIPLSLDLNFEEMMHNIFPQSDILISEDVSTMVNTGCMVFRNTEWSKNFIAEWINCKYTPGSLNEQLGFHCVYERFSESEMNFHVTILPAHILNSIAPPMNSLLPEHKVRYCLVIT
jgi:hypothetical protein